MKLNIPEDWKELYDIQEGQYHLKNFIGGKWDRFTTEEKEVHSPYDGSTVAFVPYQSGEGIELAFQTAWENQRTIGDVPAIERIEIFEKAAALLQEREDLFVQALVLDAGKPYKNAKGEIHATISRMKMVAEEARKIYGEYMPGDWAEDTMQRFAIVMRQPLGTVLCIAPFNYPLFLTAAKVIPALLAGNSVVVKLPSADPVTFLLYARILEEAGFPAGSLNVITTSGKTLSAYLDSEKIDAITFTGSTGVGKKIANATSGMKHLHMELGGNGAAIVTEHADMELAVKKSVHGALNNSGQRCDAVSRVIVIGNAADEYVRRTVETVRSEKYGDPSDEEVTVGPLIDRDSVESVDALVKDAVEKGAELLEGGEYDGNIYRPTVLDKVPRDARIMHEETFGPVIPIHRVRDLDEALEVANDTRYGLDSCIFTNDFYEAWKAANALHDGEITINNAPSHGTGYFPYGGTGDSGIGRQGVGYSVEELTRLKTVVFNLAPAHLGKSRQIYPL